MKKGTMVKAIYEYLLRDETRIDKTAWSRMLELGI